MKWSLSVILEQPKYAELSSNLQQEFTDEVKKVFSGDCGPENKQWCSLLENLDTTVNRRYLLFTKLIVLNNTMKHFLQLPISIAKPNAAVFPSHSVSVLRIAKHTYIWSSCFSNSSGDQERATALAPVLHLCGRLFPSHPKYTAPCQVFIKASVHACTPPLCLKDARCFCIKIIIINTSLKYSKTSNVYYQNNSFEQHEIVPYRHRVLRQSLKCCNKLHQKHFLFKAPVLSCQTPHCQPAKQVLHRARWLSEGPIYLQRNVIL